MTFWVYYIIVPWQEEQNKEMKEVTKMIRFSKEAFLAMYTVYAEKVNERLPGAVKFDKKNKTITIDWKPFDEAHMDLSNEEEEMFRNILDFTDYLPCEWMITIIDE